MVVFVFFLVVFLFLYRCVIVCSFKVCLVAFVRWGWGSLLVLVCVPVFAAADQLKSTEGGASFPEPYSGTAKE